MSSSRRRDLARSILRCSYLSEPILDFAAGGKHVDPRAGIARYGPRSFGTSRHPRIVRVGVIGSAQTIEDTSQWITDIADGVDGNEKHPEFPGFSGDRGFYSDILLDPAWNGQVSQSEVRDLVNPNTTQHDRFEEAVRLLASKVQLISEKDSHPDYIVVALPDAVLKSCRVADYHDDELGLVHRDFRRAFKARTMRFRIPTQILLMPTIDGRDSTPKSKIAWNFSVGMYFKAGGTPWSPASLAPGTCYVGISFFRSLGTKNKLVRTSLAQAFDERGDGLVLRGHDFEWDPAKRGSRAPHLNDQQAAELTERVLERYERETGTSPRRIVIHKRSRFWMDEKAGFEDALRARVSNYDLVALEPQRHVRLVTQSTYPPLRGTWLRLGDLDYLYTMGFIPSLQEYHAMHVPSPVRLADHIGQDTSREELLREVLTLTKMSPNSATFSNLLPVTLEFSDLVGDILREFPTDVEPQPQFKYYM